MGSPLGRKLQPPPHLLHALPMGKLGVVLHVIRWQRALNVRFGPGPEETRRTHSLLLRQHPQRSPAVPCPMGYGLLIFVAVNLFTRRIVESVRYDPVMLRIKPRNNRIVVRKGD